MAAVVQMCGACDLARQSFNRPHATLSPLSIRGLLYRWSIDLCGPFPLTRQLNSYCMVLVLPVGVLPARRGWNPRGCSSAPDPSRAASESSPDAPEEGSECGGEWGGGLARC